MADTDADTRNISTNMVVVFKGGETSYLYTLEYDGSTWSGGLRIGKQPGGVDARSKTPPAACYYNNALYLLYRGDRSDDFALRTATYFEGSWYGPNLIHIKNPDDRNAPDQPSLSDGTPALCEFQGLMYAIYKEPGGRMRYAAFDGSVWEGGQYISINGIQPSTKTSGISAVVYGEKLYVIFRSDHGDFRYAYFNGSTWEGNDQVRLRRRPSEHETLVPQSRSAATACAYDNKLWIIYRGLEHTDLFLSTYDGTEWTGNDRIGHSDVHPQSKVGPGSIVFRDSVFLVYRGVDHKSLWTASFSKKGWKGDTEVEKQPWRTKKDNPESDQVPQLAYFPTTSAGPGEWMKHARPDIPVWLMTLPGTHDSAAIGKRDTPYTNQNATLTEQLEAGIRLLDIRLAVTKPNGYVFRTCHGHYPWNMFQSFLSALSECQEFLGAHPSELVVMSLQIDDWNDYGSDKPGVTAALRQLLLSYPAVANVGRDLGSPLLDSLRGKIYLVNRITSDNQFGVPVAIPDNTPGIFLDPIGSQRPFMLYVQDKWKDLSSVDPVADKTGIFIQAIRIAGQYPLINFGSGTEKNGLVGVHINRNLLRHLGRYRGSERPQRFGWCLFDYATNRYPTSLNLNYSCIDLAIASNFGYEGYDKPYTMLD